MDLHLVGGFLGSGKTTAIIAAAKQLMAAGKVVGVVTNDQGKYLVDTAFMQLNQIPAVQVSGGCFCCHIDDLEARLAELEINQQPDVIFAESVGSCGVLVSTVIKPLMNLSSSKFAPSSFSVFVDSRLLEMRLAGEELPFSEAVAYIFDKQIEEADRLVINKADLLSGPAAAALLSAAQMAFPTKHIRLQTSTNAADVSAWLASLTDPLEPSLATVAMDYDQYLVGESELSWLDLIAHLELPTYEPRRALMDIVTALLAALEGTGWTIGHCKLLVSGPNWFGKLSQTAIHDSGWEDSFPIPTTQEAQLLLNVRVSGPSTEVDALMRTTLVDAAQLQNVKVTSIATDHFHPTPPAPRYLMP